MAKSAGKGQQYLAVAGGLALFLAAWRFEVPMIFAEKATVLSAIAVLLGILVGWKQGALISAIYVVAVIMGLPQLVWGGHSGDPFFANSHSGLNLGLIAAAAVAGKIAPGSQAGYGRLFLAALAGHGVYLLCGFVWALGLHFYSLQGALQAIVYPALIPAAVKTAGTFLIAAVAARFVK